MDHYLFSYGTLQLEQVQLETFERLLYGIEDILIGYRIEQVKIKDSKILVLSQESYHPIAIRTAQTKN